jgi:hypothetical protein
VVDGPEIDICHEGSDVMQDVLSFEFRIPFVPKITDTTWMLWDVILAKCGSTKLSGIIRPTLRYALKFPTPIAQNGRSRTL